MYDEDRVQTIHQGFLSVADSDAMRGALESLAIPVVGVGQYQISAAETSGFSVC